MYEYLPIEQTKVGDIVEFAPECKTHWAVDQKQMTINKLYKVKEITDTFNHIYVTSDTGSDFDNQRSNFKLIKTKPGDQAQIGDTIIYTDIAITKHHPTITAMKPYKVTQISTSLVSFDDNNGNSITLGPVDRLVLCKKETKPNITVGSKWKRLKANQNKPAGEIIIVIKVGQYSITWDNGNRGLPVNTFLKKFTPYKEQTTTDNLCCEQTEIKSNTKEKTMTIKNVTMTDARPQPKTLEELLIELFGTQAVTDLKNRPKFVAHVFNDNEELVQIIGLNTDEDAIEILSKNRRKFLDYTIITYKMKNQHKLHIPVTTTKA